MRNGDGAGGTGGAEGGKALVPAGSEAPTEAEGSTEVVAGTDGTAKLDIRDDIGV